MIKYYILICFVSKYQEVLSIFKAKCTCYLQSWTSWLSSRVRCCYFIWCVTQTNVSHGRTTTSGCLHIAKKRWCSLVNHPSKDGPCLPVPEGVMSTCTYFRTAKIIAVSTSSYHVPTPRRYYIQSTFHKVYVQGNIPQIIFTKLPCIAIAASERVSLYHFVIRSGIPQISKSVTGTCLLRQLQVERHPAGPDTASTCRKWHFSAEKHSPSHAHLRFDCSMRILAQVWLVWWVLFQKPLRQMEADE